MTDCERSLFTLWRDLTVDELWVYFCLQIVMGLVHKPSIHAYWSQNHVINTPLFYRLMRRDRFEQIRKMIHFTDPLSENHEDSLSKLKSFLDALRTSFRANYTPSKHIAVDEYLSLWKGRLKFRMYIPSKRERYRIKIYMICESDTGYLSNFIVYTGDDTKYPQPSVPLPKEFDEYTNPSKVVLTLMEGFYGKGHNLAIFSSENSGKCNFFEKLSRIAPLVEKREYDLEQTFFYFSQATYPINQLTALFWLN